MSASGAVSAQNYTHFHVTQEIWNQAWHSNDGFSMKSLCAKVACIVFPILLSVAIVEGIVWAVRSVFKIPSDPKSVPLDPQSVKQVASEEINDAPAALPTATAEVEEVLGTGRNTNILTVALPEGSSLGDIEVNLFDLENERPPASAYHALVAAYFIAREFNAYATHIRENRIDHLVARQHEAILFGTGDYFRAVKQDPSLKEAADLENIRIKDPTYLLRFPLHFEPTNKEPKHVVEHAYAIVQHLFIPREEPKAYESRRIVQVALLKSTNNQTTSVVCAANQAIFFNSHKNETTLTVGKEATQAYLTEILGPFGVMQGEYALGRYDLTVSE